MYASIYVYVTVMYVISNMMCNSFVFVTADYALSVLAIVALLLFYTFYVTP